MKPPGKTVSCVQKKQPKAEKRIKLKSAVNRYVKDRPDRRSDLNIRWDDYWDLVNESLMDWERTKHAVEEMADRFQDLADRTGNADYIRRSVALHDCGSHIVYGAQGRILYINGCRDRLCPSCNRRHARETLKQLKEIIDVVTQDEVDRNVPADERSRWYMLTLTVPSVPGPLLKDALTKMALSYEAFQGQGYMSWVKGSYRTTEITYNPKTRLFHPHYHIFIQADPVELRRRKRVRGTFLQREWTRLNNYFYTDAGPEEYEYTFNYAEVDCDDPVFASEHRLNSIMFDPAYEVLSIYSRKARVKYYRTGQICDSSTVLYEYDEYLGQDVESQRNLLQLEIHEFVDFKDKKGPIELCKYISNCIFHVDDIPLTDLDYFAQAVKRRLLYRHGGTFRQIIKDLADGKYDDKFHRIDDEDLSSKLELNKIKNAFNSKEKEDLKRDLLFACHAMYKRQFKSVIRKGRHGLYFTRVYSSDLGSYSFVGTSGFADTKITPIPGCRDIVLKSTDTQRFKRWKEYMIKLLLD